MTDPMTRTEAEPLSASEALRRLIEFADDYEAIARAAHVWDKDGAPETIVRRIQQYRSVAARSNSSEAQTARLALLYALLDRSPAVDLPHLLAGEAVWDYAERSAMHIFGVSTGNRRSDQLLVLLADGAIDWKSAKQELGVRESVDLQEAVDVLVGAGLATVQTLPRKGGGRPLRVIAAAKRGEQRVTKGARTHVPAQPEGGLETA